MADVDTDAPDAVGGGSDAGGVGLAEILVGREPVVVDAGALGLTGATAPRVLTPHRGELARLRARLGMSPDWADDAAAARETAVATGATVLLKGARTWVATPGGWLGLVESGAPWLSTAGTGDVLAGVVGALVAARSSAVVADPEALGPLAASAAWLHGAAGRIASGTARADGGLGSGEATRTAGAGHPLVALEVAEAIPTVWARLIG
jgi:NAD(P)H-hydrate repair Nnr-like enzyme with NAD(P)H-hydrate dehydratase domain